MRVAYATQESRNSTTRREHRPAVRPSVTHSQTSPGPRPTLHAFASPARSGDFPQSASHRVPVSGFSRRTEKRRGFADTLCDSRFKTPIQLHNPED